MREPRLRVTKGDRYARLTVLEDRQTGSRSVLCRCDCGAERPVDIYSLLGGKTESCGCLRTQLHSVIHHKHGSGYEDYRYRLWKNMRSRCLRPTNPNYDVYGGRGISIYEPWVESFEVFAEWIDKELGPRPEGGTLDRIDNDGNYEPGNLRWASRFEQGQNRRKHYRKRRPKVPAPD